MADPNDGKPPEIKEEEDLPGRPFADGELDPELLKLPRAPLRVGWLMSLAATTLCLVTIVKLWSDLSFWRQGDKAAPVATTEELLAADEESFVAFHGIPDRAYLGRVFHGAEGIGLRTVPLAGTDGQVWFLFPGSAFDTAVSYDETQIGRLRALEAVPFAESLRTWLETQPALLQPITVASAIASLGDASKKAQTPAGDTVPVDKTTTVRLQEQLPGKALLTVHATETMPNEAHWNAALVARELLARGTKPERETDTSWTYLVDAKNGLAPIAQTLAAAGMVATELKPWRREYRTTWDRLAATDRFFLVEGQEIPFDDVLSLAVAAKRSLPENARILIAGQRPGDYWYVPVLCAVFALLGGLFAWTFVLALRRDRPTVVATES